MCCAHLGLCAFRPPEMSTVHSLKTTPLLLHGITKIAHSSQKKNVHAVIRLFFVFHRAYQSAPQKSHCTRVANNKTWTVVFVIFLMIQYVINHLLEVISVFKVVKPRSEEKCGEAPEEGKDALAFVFLKFKTSRVSITFRVVSLR